MWKRIFSFLFWKQEIESVGKDIFQINDPLRRTYNWKTGQYTYPETYRLYVIYKRTNTVTGKVKLVKKYID